MTYFSISIWVVERFILHFVYNLFNTFCKFAVLPFLIFCRGRVDVCTVGIKNFQGLWLKKQWSCDPFVWNFCLICLHDDFNCTFVSHVKSSWELVAWCHRVHCIYLGAWCRETKIVIKPFLSTGSFSSHPFHCVLHSCLCIYPFSSQSRLSHTCLFSDPFHPKSAPQMVVHFSLVGLTSCCSALLFQASGAQLHYTLIPPNFNNVALNDHILSWLLNEFREEYSRVFTIN